MTKAQIMTKDKAKFPKENTKIIKELIKGIIKKTKSKLNLEIIYLFQNKIRS